MLTSPEELVRPDRHIFLSPHYDDIALSCGGTAASLSSSGRTPEVALIFGDHPDPNVPMTAFAEELHRKWGMSAAEVIEGRRREEELASIALGTCDRFLPFRDAIYRGDRYQSDEELFGSPKPDEDEIADQICDELQITSRDEKRTRVYAPLAIGSHVDHHHAYRAGLCLHKRGYEVWFYEDLPYGLKPEHVADRAGFLALDLIGPVRRSMSLPSGTARLTRSWPTRRSWRSSSVSTSESARRARRSARRWRSTPGRLEVGRWRSGSGPSMDELRRGKRTYILIGIAILIVWALTIPLLF